MRDERDDDDLRRHEVIALAATARRRSLQADEKAYARKLLTASLPEGDDFSEKIAFAGAAAFLWRRLGEDEKGGVEEMKVRAMAERTLAGVEDQALCAAFNNRLERVILFG